MYVIVPLGVVPPVTPVTVAASILIALPVYVAVLSASVIVGVALLIVIVALAVGVVSLWFASPFTYACTYVVPADTLDGFVVDQASHVVPPSVLFL